MAMLKRSQTLVLAGIGAAVGAVAGAFVASTHVSYSELLRIVPSATLWIAFSVYWGIASRNAAPTQKSESSASTVFHQSVLAIALVLLVLPVPGLMARFVPATILVTATGAGIQVGFLFLAVWARRHLGRNWSAEVRIAVDHQLVRTGPYRHLRHPIYTAMLGMFLGTAISIGQLHSLVALFILAVTYWRKTRLEEGILLKTFGSDYESYRQDTWALVPLLF
jgi:protein-S-isoprenylcysteine O-methyltransferase Ste14